MSSRLSSIFSSPLLFNRNVWNLETKSFSKSPKWFWDWRTGIPTFKNYLNFVVFWNSWVFQSIYRKASLLNVYFQVASRSWVVKWHSLSIDRYENLLPHGQKVSSDSHFSCRQCCQRLKVVIITSLVWNGLYLQLSSS